MQRAAGSTNVFIAAPVAMVMPQAAFLCVTAWLGEVPFERGLFDHVARWQLIKIAYAHLDWSIAAWSPSRAAVVKVAMRLLICSGQRDLDRRFQLEARLDRQQRRALAALPFLDGADTVLGQVRELVRAHRVMLSVMAGLLRMHPQLIEDIAVLRDAAGGRVTEDGSSSSEEEL